MAQKATYDRLRAQLTLALVDLEILAGNRVGHSDASWKDVVGTAAVNLRVLASMLDEARKGNHEVFIVFPDPAECLEAATTLELPRSAIDCNGRRVGIRSSPRVTRINRPQ